MNNILKLTLSAIGILVLSACSRDDSNDAPPKQEKNEKPYAVHTYDKNAFNRYDADTFAASTCTPLAMEVPVGVFASLDGDANATGSQSDPLDLQTALENNTKVADGETLWLMEGVYEGTFTSELRGSVNSPIKVKPYPGKYVMIDTTKATSGAGLLINGSARQLVCG